MIDVHDGEPGDMAPTLLNYLESVAYYLQEASAAFRSAVWCDEVHQQFLIKRGEMCLKSANELMEGLIRAYNDEQKRKGSLQDQGHGADRPDAGNPSFDAC